MRSKAIDSILIIKYPPKYPKENKRHYFRIFLISWNILEKVSWALN